MASTFTVSRFQTNITIPIKMQSILKRPESRQEKAFQKLAQIIVKPKQFQQNTYENNGKSIAKRYVTPNKMSARKTNVQKQFRVSTPVNSEKENRLVQNFFQLLELKKKKRHIHSSVGQKKKIYIQQNREKQIYLSRQIIDKRRKEKNNIRQIGFIKSADFKEWETVETQQQNIWDFLER